MKCFKIKEIFVFAIIFILLIWGISASEESNVEGFFFLVLLGVMVAAGIMYLVRNNITMKCDRCRAKGAVVYVGEQVVGEKQLRKLKETDSTGRRVQPYYVYGEELTIRKEYRCKKCGAVSYKTYRSCRWDTAE